MPAKDQLYTVREMRLDETGRGRESEGRTVAERVDVAREDEDAAREAVQEVQLLTDTPRAQ